MLKRIQSVLGQAGTRFLNKDTDAGLRLCTDYEGRQD